MLNDSLNGRPGRIAGGVNIDGLIYGPVLIDGIGAGEKSFLAVGQSGPQQSTRGYGVLTSRLGLSGGTSRMS